MDVFSTLPPELIAPILENLPDLRSLYSVTSSSPCVFHFMCSSMGVGVLESILQSPFQDHPTTPWIPYILRVVALIRQCTSSKQPAANLTSFITTYIMPTTYQNARGEHVPDLQSCPPKCLPRIQLRDVINRGPHAFLPREMLFLAWRIDGLAARCFDFFHERIKDTNPQHLPNKRPSVRQPPWNVRTDSRPQGRPYAIDAGGQASWYEMQRLCLGFWSLQLCYELSNAASEGRLAWSDADVEAVRDMGSGMCLSGFEKSSLWVAREPLWAALIYTRHLEGTLEDISCAGDTDRGLSGFYNTGFRPLEDRHLRLPSPRIGKGVWPPAMPSPPPFPCIDEQDAVTYHCHRVLVGCKGLRWAPHLLRPRSTPRLSDGLLFRPFRLLGFGIWDNERLSAMEMLNDPTSNRPKRFELWCPDQMFTWTSLLSQSQMGQLQRYQEELATRSEETEGVAGDASAIGDTPRAGYNDGVL
ncbi:hypothetical protein FZEAL_8670 [Fusarium zealandicum]|uniref:F-box domain-containing protein n=1 Tax=Fusarium zealandicum TaxID=1053134 RepID=A0A8H4UDD3_9HYPO|nr:hypothetical protein FZEAL_8670 [Fusarium zealandicum]